MYCRNTRKKALRHKKAFLSDELTKPLRHKKAFLSDERTSSQKAFLSDELTKALRHKKAFLSDEGTSSKRAEKGLSLWRRAFAQNVWHLLWVFRQNTNLLTF